MCLVSSAEQSSRSALAGLLCLGRCTGPVCGLGVWPPVIALHQGCSGSGLRVLGICGEVGTQHVWLRCLVWLVCYMLPFACCCTQYKWIWTRFVTGG